MVAADNPARGTTLPAALHELVSQMTSAAQSTALCTVGATATALSSNQGNGAIVLNIVRGDGRVQENIVAETAALLCTTDSQTGGALPGNEIFNYVGQPDQGDPSLDNWPTGSGANAVITSIASASSNAGGNLLTNSDFENWSGSPLALNNWTLAVGTWATDILREGTTVYSGAYSLKVIGGGALVALAQSFINATVGTPAVLLPERSYAVHFSAKVDVVPAAGALTLELVNGSGTVIHDDAGNANSMAFSVPSLTSSWASYSAVFRLPRLIPLGVQLRLRVSTGITAGSNLFIDGMAMAPMTALYNGGPSVAIFCGSTPWVAGDGWTVAQTNDRAGTLYSSTFQAMFDRFFAMRSLGLLLPSSASPTVSDALMS